MFTAPHFQSHDEARKYLEALRWAGEPVCPHCGTIGKSYPTKKAGVYRCAAKECRKDFSVTTKTVMESSHIKLNVWLQAFYLMASSKKGMSAHQLHRSLKITYKSAWFLAHRIREAMRAGGILTPMGGEGKVVEADETYFGKRDVKPTTKRSGEAFRYPKMSRRNNRSVVALVERGGSVRSFHPAFADKDTVQKIVRENVARESRLYTDESKLYPGADVAAHETVKHSEYEYVRGDVHSNTVEGFFSILKRGMRGVYQHCKEKHLHRYLAEYDFRYNHRIALGYNDGERADIALKGIAGKRLTYRPAH